MERLKEIGERIRQKRKQLGITQDALAQMAGYTSRSSINKIEKGLVDLPRSKIVEIAEALNTTPAYLMGWEEEKNPPAEPQLTEGEEKLLKLIRLMPEEMKKQYTELLEATLKALGLIQ
mgnify:CR=1 FL=1